VNILITLLIKYFLPNKLFKKRIFCLCFITYMGHFNLGNILFMFHRIHGTFKFREFGAAASNKHQGFAVKTNIYSVECTMHHQRIAQTSLPLLQRQQPIWRLCHTRRNTRSRLCMRTMLFCHGSAERCLEEVKIAHTYPTFLAPIRHGVMLS
jgi:hypothetical protein